MTYAVTGSTGALGSRVVDQLVKLGVPAASIVAVARSREKAAALESKGVSVRIADYADPASLDAALAGVDRVLLISGTEVGKRAGQHANVIAAAKKAGVKLIGYTSITRAETSTSPLAPEHKATEASLEASGVPYVLLRHNWYTENYLGEIDTARATGTVVSAAGDGKVSSATRDDYAEADARALVADDSAGKTYELAGKSWGFGELAAAVASIVGKPVAYEPVDADTRRKLLIDAGLPEGVAGFVTAIDESIAAGALHEDSTDLERILGRTPQSLEAGLRANMKK